MSEESTIATVTNPTPAEREANRLLVSLEAAIMPDPARARAAARYGERLRFGLARVLELRISADTLGGVFEPARLEVALSILESQVVQAQIFANGLIAPKAKRLATHRRRHTRTEASEADVDLAGVTERAA